MWNCPSCFLPLSTAGQSRCCENGHSFDVAKEGYLNLLLAQHKRSKEPGDNKEMVNARREFLQEGHYQPLAKHLTELLMQYSSSETLRLFDAGCGEGYYLNAISTALSAQARVVHASGIDISKIAVQKAAKRYANFDFAVASSYKLPLEGAQLDAVIQIFAPSAESEILRVLAPSGLWLQVNPAAGHLAELKQALYDTPQEHTIQTSLPEGFTIISEQTLNFSVTLATPQQRSKLLMMTPYYWSASAQKQQAWLDLTDNVSADFSIRVLQKH